MRAHRKPSKRQKVSQASTAKDIRDMDNMTALTSDRLSNPPASFLFFPEQPSALLMVEPRSVSTKGSFRPLDKGNGFSVD
jgi:hypothetical protein